MKKNSYPRFIQSEQYRNLLQNAPQPIPKKTYVLVFPNSIKFSFLLPVEYFILLKTITFEHHRVVAKMNTIPMIQLEKVNMQQHLDPILQINLNQSVVLRRILLLQSLQQM